MALLFCHSLRTPLPRELLVACSLSLSTSSHPLPAQSRRSFSVLDRPPPNYPGHVPLPRIERVGLAAGSAIMSLLNPRRGDLIAALGEATATPYFIYRLRDVMLSSPTGRRILRDRPRISSETMSMTYLRNLPSNTVGRAYA